MEIIFATKNKGKMLEVKEIMKDTQFVPLSMEDAGVDIDVVEDGAAFEENASKKAYEIMKATGKITLADDSGLEIDFLDKAPGVYSARYLGEHTDYSYKNTHILHLMKDVPDENRTARFVCAIAAAIPEGIAGHEQIFVEKAALNGLIGHEIAGKGGFGYDPIFFVPMLGMTTAEMTPEQKNGISHRGKALRQMKEKLMKLLG